MPNNKKLHRRLILSLLCSAGAASALPLRSIAQTAPRFNLSRVVYFDRLNAIWHAQLMAVFLTVRFEHKVAAAVPIDNYPQTMSFAWLDDDWYYEMCALRGFEKFGINMSIDELGQQWLENNCGSWGSSAVTLENLKRGIKGSMAGHPRHNRYWWTIGAGFSAEIYGAIAPAMPNVAAAMARRLGKINGYGEAVDGAVFIAGAISIAFSQTDPKAVVRQAATLIDKSSPYRQAIDFIIESAARGFDFDYIVKKSEDKWRVIYPQSNNSVANGAIAAAALWFGEADFWKTINLAARAADYSDSDCNAAFAIAVIGAMRGMAALPPALVAQLSDRIIGEKMNNVAMTPPVDEKISELARRSAIIGERIISANNGYVGPTNISLVPQIPVPQAPENFTLNGLMQYWNADWSLERAGFGGAIFGGAEAGTYLAGDILATYPQESARGCYMHHKLRVGENSYLRFEAAAENAKAWELNVFIDNRMVHNEIISASSPIRAFEKIEINLAEFANKEVTIRLYQKIANINDRPASTAFWRNLTIA